MSLRVFACPSSRSSGVVIARHAASRRIAYSTHGTPVTVRSCRSYCDYRHCSTSTRVCSHGMMDLDVREVLRNRAIVPCTVVWKPRMCRCRQCSTQAVPPCDFSSRIMNRDRVSRRPLDPCCHHVRTNHNRGLGFLINHSWTSSQAFPRFALLFSLTRVHHFFFLSLSSMACTHF